MGRYTSERIILYVEADLDGLAADFAVFDVDLTAHRQVENHRNLFPTIWTVNTEEIPSSDWTKDQNNSGLFQSVSTPSSN